MVDDASWHLSCYTSTHAAIWHSYGDMAPFIGHVAIRLPWSTSYVWSIVTMRLSSTVMEIWPFEVLPERLFQEQRSVVGRFSI